MPINKGLATREVFAQHLPYTSRHSSGKFKPKKRAVKEFSPKGFERLKSSF
jgi:hypothetical protein